jgi:hypothetical protein
MAIISNGWTPEFEERRQKRMAAGGPSAEPRQSERASDAAGDAVRLFWLVCWIVFLSGLSWSLLGMVMVFAIRLPPTWLLVTVPWILVVTAVAGLLLCVMKDEVQP